MDKIRKDQSNVNGLNLKMPQLSPNKRTTVQAIKKQFEDDSVQETDIDDYNDDIILLKQNFTNSQNKQDSQHPNQVIIDKNNEAS